MKLGLLTALGLVAVFATSVAAMRRQQVTTINLLEDDPLAKFSKLMPAIRHPRCVNCHGGTNPFTGVNHPNSMEEFDPAEARRLRDGVGDHNFRNVANPDVTCTTGCHNDRTDTPIWFLAPRRMTFLNQRPITVCSMWQLDKRNSGPELRAHLTGDTLIVVAFKGTKAIREDPPDPPEPIRAMTRDRFLALADEWLKAGNGDIPCGGWEGTITQTERVSLTTNHGTVMGGIEERTTETQDATRTITIALDGTVNFRIAVQGTHTWNTTMVVNDGGKRCEATQRTSQVYGTENGETTGEAKTAILTFLPGGAYALNFAGPDEKTVNVERITGSHCVTGPGPEDVTSVASEHKGWTLSLAGVLANPSDRMQLKGSETQTITRPGDAWLTTSGGAAAPDQTRDNGDLLPVPVEVTTTWDLRRRR